MQKAILWAAHPEPVPLGIVRANLYHYAQDIRMDNLIALAAHEQNGFVFPIRLLRQPSDFHPSPALVVVRSSQDLVVPPSVTSPRFFRETTLKDGLDLSERQAQHRPWLT